MSDMTDHERVDWYFQAAEDENAEHYDTDNPVDDNQPVDSVIDDTDHVDYGATDQSRKVEHMQDERSGTVEAARQLQRTLNASRTNVSRVIGAASEMVLKTVIVKSPLDPNYNGPTKLVDINQWRSAVTIWIPATDVQVVAISDDPSCRWNVATNEYPLNGVLLTSNASGHIHMLRLVTVRALYAITEYDQAVSGGIPICVQEEFVA